MNYKLKLNYNYVLKGKQPLLPAGEVKPKSEYSHANTVPKLRSIKDNWTGIVSFIKMCVKKTQKEKFEMKDAELRKKTAGGAGDEQRTSTFLEHYATWLLSAQTMIEYVI